jgi:2-keto-4-pentenoate hydratase/2-oxohepta-3-ene-1,7-dioic acid hydratase in catechol pathway
MRIGVIAANDGPRLVLSRPAWFDLTTMLTLHAQSGPSQAPAPRRLEDLLHAGQCDESYLESVAGALDARGLLDCCALPEAPSRFLLPLRPGKIVALGRNYAEHARETGHEAPSAPILFAKSPSSCIGDGEPIVIRSAYGRVDHEAELAVVIGQRARALEPEDACRVIAGYTCLNDVTERDMQKRDINNGHPWFLSKSLDTFGPLGPVVALPSEAGWPVEVDVECRVNGEVRQKSNTRHFVFGLGEVLAYITRHVTLEPGDVVSTGTPEGIGPIAPGDRVEVSVERVGTLTNVVRRGR